MIWTERTILFGILCLSAIVDENLAHRADTGADASFPSRTFKALEAQLESVLNSDEFSYSDEAEALGINDEDPRVLAILAAVKRKKQKGISLELDEDGDWWLEKEDWWRDPFALFEDENDEVSQVSNSDMQTESSSSPKEGEFDSNKNIRAVQFVGIFKPKKHTESLKPSFSETIASEPSSPGSSESQPYVLLSPRNIEKEKTRKNGSAVKNSATENKSELPRSTEESKEPILDDSSHNTTNANEAVKNAPALLLANTDLVALGRSLYRFRVVIQDWSSSKLFPAISTSAQNMAPPLVTVLSIAAVTKALTQVAWNNAQEDPYSRFNRLTAKVLKPLPWIDKTKVPSTKKASEIGGPLANQVKTWKKRCLRAESEKQKLQNDYEEALREIGQLTEKVANLKISNRYLQSVQRDQDALLERAVAAAQREGYKERQRLKSAMLHITEKELEMMRDEIQHQAAELKNRLFA